MNIFHIGLAGEIKAARHLKKLGFRILQKNYRTPHGEIDLIAMDGDTLVFVEVKNRPAGKMGDGISAVDGQKRKHLRYAAKCYLAAHPAAAARFDCVEITSSGLRHVSNAF